MGKIRDYDYKAWEWLRIFPQYKKMEEELNKLDIAYQKECAKNNRLQRRLDSIEKIRGRRNEK